MESTPGGKLCRAFSKPESRAFPSLTPVDATAQGGGKEVGLLPPVSRSAWGIRDYGEIDLKRVEFIIYMRSDGLPIDALTRYYQLVQQGDGTIEARKVTLNVQREQLMTKMIERGTHDQLLAMGGLYNQLYETQFNREKGL